MFLRVGRWVAGLSPPARSRLARGLLWLPALNIRRRRIASINLALCFPQLAPARRQALLEATLRSNATGALDTLCAWFATPSRLAGTATIHGLEHLQAALAQGRGAVVVGAHYDGIELAMRHVADAIAQPMPILVRRHNDPAIEAVIAAGRGAYAGQTFDKKDIAGFAAQVRAGKAVFYVPDQNAARRTVFVPFLGVPAATLGAIGGVLRRCGGQVLLMWACRDAAGRQHIDLVPAWPAWPTADDTTTAARYMQWVGERLQAAPEQYLWVHRRFKTRPPGAPSVY
ncbi:MAG: lysophospholipid acyltransferase family protein [Xanthomonadaceae bacterium]|nr:lysophospholipid acyltransferase family protein [Xanthomonadaceae bacterium]